MVKLWVSIMLMWFAMVQTAHAEVSAELNQYIVPYGVSVQLTITAVSDTDGEPDIARLKNDFDILGQSQSSNYSFINGSMHSSKTWTYGLMPKREGMVQVPAIEVGKGKTKALMLRVIGAQNKPKSAREIWLETSLSQDETWVQAQTVLTIKLVRAVNLSQADLSDPDIADAIVKRTGDDRNYEAVVDGRRVIVTERQYAVFPQKAGDLTIPSVQFNGIINQSGSMFNQGKTMRLRSEPLSLHVKPKPSTWQSGAWLPAQSLTLQEQWLDGTMPTYRVGEAFTRVIELQAQGLTAAQLPLLLEGKEVDGFKLYPDKPELNVLVKDEGIVGVRREKVAMVPTKAGKLWLPEIRVTWWNTATQTTQHAIIAAREIEVLPALQQQGQVIKQPPESASEKVQAATLAASSVEVPQQVQTKSSSFWQWVAWALTGLWLLTLALWWKSTHQRQPRSHTQQAESPKLSAVEKALKQACEHNDAKKALNLLPAWGAAYFDDASIQYLAQLKGKSPALDVAMANFERYLYAPSETGVWSGGMLLDAIKSLSHHKGVKNKQEAMLAPLYPKQNKE